MTPAAAAASSAPADGSASESVRTLADPTPHPVVPPRDHAWPGVMLIIILSLFLAAAVIGSVVRANESDPESRAGGAPPTDPPGR